LVNNDCIFLAEKCATGLAEWNNIADAVEAVILANNHEISHPSKFSTFIFIALKLIESLIKQFYFFSTKIGSKFPYTFKLCFSATPVND
jgi:hypothetical protein